MKLIISFATYSVKAEIFDTATGRAIYNSLPIKCNVSSWGNEIYFELPVNVELEEGAQAEVSMADLAYWPNMPAFCIFYGPTPASSGDNPVAASPVNVFGKLLETDIDSLRRIKDGENVVVEKAD